MNPKKLLLTVGIVVALAVLFLSRPKHLNQEPPANGNFAPNFTLPQLTGAPLELSNYSSVDNYQVGTLIVSMFDGNSKQLILERDVEQRSFRKP